MTETNNTDQSAIIGKWKLVKTASGRTAEGIIIHTCATIAVVFEFKSDYIRLSNACGRATIAYPIETAIIHTCFVLTEIMKHRYK